ncbi:MAG TPA: OmpA family protein [Thermoanaerobaculia bacterium]
MWRYLGTFLLSALIVALPAAAQTPSQAVAQGELNLQTQALQVLAAAENAGAPTLAKSLYDDAQWRIRFATENWNAPRAETRDQARLRAEESLWAGRAALAKAQWLSTNLAIRQLQSDITKFGGRSDLALQDEPPAIDYGRGSTTKEHVAAAQAAIDQAKAAGADQIAGNDLKTAQDNVNTARKIASSNRQNENADHLAYVAEMIARRAYYLARGTEASRNMPALQLQRTQLAQAASEKQAAADRAQREQSERDRAALQQQLASEQANRATVQQQLQAAQQAAEQRSDADRAARVQAEQQLDELTRKYQTAITTGNASDVETMRRQVEDQQIALRAIQERERLNEQALNSEIESLRTELQKSQQQGTADSQALAERQAAVERREQELAALRKEREADLAHRQEVEKQNQATISDAQRQRQEAEAQAQQLRAQLQQAQQAAQQQAQQSQAELEKSRQQALTAQAELERTRQELARRDAEARRLKLQQELSRVATTKSSDRGLIVTLSSGILFDSGKSTLKPGAKKTLARIADQLKNDTSIRVAIEGHTDNVGSSDKNQTLSEKRANAVREFLAGTGVPADRITATGLGEKDPIATNKTQAGRQQNRRVELIITNG